MLRSFLVVTLLSFAITAQAEDDSQFDHRWFVSGMLSMIDDDNNRNVDDGLASASLSIGTGFRGSSAFELNVFGSELNADGFDADQKQWGFGVNSLWRLGRSDYFAPYFLLGGGFMNSQFDNPTIKDTSGMTGSTGFGVLIPLRFYRLFLRTELSLRADLSYSEKTDYFLSFGLQRPISKKIVIPIDSDFDSVIDGEDMCPGTPSKTPVDRYGCARE